MLQNSWLVLLKILKVMKSQEKMEIITKETWQRIAMWIAILDWILKQKKDIK